MDDDTDSLYKHSVASQNSFDIDNLVALVKAKPELYNSSLKDHYNQDIIGGIWREIARELNVPVADCKTKWHSLRTSYARYLRELKKIPRGSASKKKKWHLADDMSFLRIYIGPHKKSTNKVGRIKLEIQEVEELMATDSGEDTTEVLVHPDVDHIMDDLGQVDEVGSCQKTIKNDAGIVAEQMVDYMKAMSDIKSSQEDPMLTFFKSLLPDINKLSNRRQRNFKAHLIQTLNSYLDEQEEES